MWRGGAAAAAAYAGRALRSRLLADPIHHPSSAIAPIASARAACSAPSAAVPAPTVAEAAVASATVSSGAGSASDVLGHYGRCYWELSKARLRSAICSRFTLEDSFLYYNYFLG
jgi:protoheme IX farnesyltransferase